MHKPLLILALLLAGCSPVAEVSQPRFLFGTRAEPDDAVELSKFTYPEAAQVGPDLDVILVKRGSTATLVNRTTTSYKDVQLWLNKQYVAKVPALTVGGREHLLLDDAINKYGEAFPVGGLLNPDKSYPIVLAELYLGPSDDAGAGLRHKIVVRAED
jgi:hypothetical protein